MQRALVPQYRTDPACVLMLRGFYISAVSGDILRRYVDVAAIQAEYGDGELLGEGC
jgi:hypothetical protein